MKCLMGSITVTLIISIKSFSCSLHKLILAILTLIFPRSVKLSSDPVSPTNSDSLYVKLTGNFQRQHI